MTDVAVTAKRSRMMEGSERHPRDAIVVAAALTTAFVLSLIRIEHISDAERDVFDAINHLSNVVRTPTEAVMMLGTFIAVPIVAFVALAFRRVRLATVLLAAGCVAYAVARVSKLFIRAGRPLEVLPNSDVIVRGAAALGLGFPSGHSAVSAALAFGALPYLPRPWRYVALSVPVVVGIARVYVGAHLPLDIVGGWAIGIAAAFAVHLLMGRPSLREPGD